MLKNVSEETSGIFKCEVMGEGPSFRTAVETKAMNVVGECCAVARGSRKIHALHTGMQLLCQNDHLNAYIELSCFGAKYLYRSVIVSFFPRVQ